MNFKAKA